MIKSIEAANASAVLTDDDRDTYRILASGGQLPPGRSLERLAALGLVDPAPHLDGRHTAHDPRAAVQHLVAEVTADLARVVQRAAALPAVEALGQHFDPHAMVGGPAAEYLPTGEAMNHRIGQVVAAASVDIRTAQPGEPADRDPAIVALGAQRTIAALNTGVRVTAIYNTTAHGHSQTRGYVEQIAAAGASVRACGVTFPRMVLVDGRHLFIDNHVHRGETNSGWHVTDRSAVLWARHVYGCWWERSTRWEDVDRRTAGAVTTPRQRHILAELEAGCSQAQIGRRVGASDRTVSKDLESLRAVLGVRTLYQVMVWWATAPDRNLP